MRATVALMLLTAACGGAQQAATADAQPVAGPKTPPASPVPPGVPPPGTNPPAVPPNDPPNPDAGPVASAPPDAGPGAPADAGPGVIADVPCATPPQVLWTRSFPDSSLIDFRGIADAQGNLYWIEYAQPPAGSDSDPTAALVSVDATGNDRYRAPFVGPPADFKLSGTTLVATTGATVTGYDLATGAQLWTIDLSRWVTSFGSTTPAVPAGLVDLGTGRVALALNNPPFGGVFVLDSSSGALISNQVASTTPRFRMLSGDGTGHALFSANQTDFDSPTDLVTADVYQMDDSGNFQWIELVEGFEGVLLWTPGTLPWLSIDNSPNFDDSSTAGPHYLSAPREWIAAAAALGGTAVFDDFFGFHPKNGQFPLQLDFVRDGVIVSSGVFPEISTFNGFNAFNFPGTDHASFITQQFNQQPALCHPDPAGVAYVGTVNETSAQFCKLPFTGDSPIVAATPSAGNLVLGRSVTTTEACDSSEVDAFVIEAYARP
jgi:hypothetical protein